jgi:membrane-associated HD superfamily phosphohydrolase
MNDKILHFIAGFLLSITGIIFTPFLLLGFIFAFGKEWYDHYTKTGVVEINDIIATILGVTLAVIITMFINDVLIQ